MNEENQTLEAANQNETTVEGNASPEATGVAPAATEDTAATTQPAAGEAAVDASNESPAAPAAA